MAETEEFRCFVGGLSWNTTDKGLEEEFRHFGNVLEAKASDYFFVIFRRAFVCLSTWHVTLRGTTGGCVCAYDFSVVMYLFPPFA